MVSISPTRPTTRRSRPSAGMALGDLGDLLGMHEHALDLGRLVGAAEPALDAHVGAPARARAGQHGRQVAGRQPDHRIVAVERGDDDLADLAVGHGIAGAGPHDLQDHALVDDHALRAPGSRRRSRRHRRWRRPGRRRCRAACIRARSEGNSAPPETSALLDRAGRPAASRALSSRILRKSGTPT